MLPAGWEGDNHSGSAMFGKEESTRTGVVGIIYFGLYISLLYFTVNPVANNDWTTTRLGLFSYNGTAIDSKCMVSHVQGLPSRWCQSACLHQGHHAPLQQQSSCLSRGLPAAATLRSGRQTCSVLSCALSSMLFGRLPSYPFSLTSRGCW